MKTYWEVEVYFHHLHLGNMWRRVGGFTPRQLYPPGKEFPVTHKTGGWTGPGTVLDLTRTLIPRPSNLWPVSILTALSGLR
jgi:hypothetical protein